MLAHFPEAISTRSPASSRRGCVGLGCSVAVDGGRIEVVSMTETVVGVGRAGGASLAARLQRWPAWGVRVAT